MIAGGAPAVRPLPNSGGSKSDVGSAICEGESLMRLWGKKKRLVDYASCAG